MKHILIITEDVVKIQTFTGILGKTYAWLYLFLLKLNLIIQIWFYKLFYKVSVLTSDCFNLKYLNVNYYSQELSKLNYADKRLDYWRETHQILNGLKLKSPDFFQESGIDISAVFSARLCTNLAYEYLVYDQVYANIAERLQPDKIIRLRFLSCLNRWLLSWLLEREYRLRLNQFVSFSHGPKSVVRHKNIVLLSLDFFRHKKTLEPIFLALQKTKYRPIYVTDSFLAPFLPQAKALSRQYLRQSRNILKGFPHPLKPMITFNLVLSHLYLQAGQALFAALKPKCLIVVFDTRNLETSLSLIAKKNKVKSVMVTPNVLMDLAEINNYDTTDLVALPGRFIYNKLIHQGIDKNKLRIVGDLQIVSKSRLTKKEIYQRLGILDINKKLILLISFRPNWLIPFDEKKLFVTWSYRVARQFPKAVLVLKPHPTERRYRVFEELDRWGLTDLIVSNNQSLSLFDLLSVAKVVLETWSTTIFEAITLNRPVICINPLQKNYDFFLPVIKQGGAVEVTSQPQLKVWLNKFLTDPQTTKQQLIKAQKAIDYFVRPQDGHEIQRVLKLLE